MSDLRTSLQNNFQTVTTGAITDGDLTIPVDTIGDLTSPAYVTLVSLDGSDREVLLADGTWGASSLVCSDVSSRGLDGSTSGAQAWSAGTTVEVRPLAQHFRDLHDRIDADRTDFDAHDHDGTDSPTVATSNLTGHDKATHDGLGIDAATLDGNLPTAFAAVAGDTFTGPVTFEDAVTAKTVNAVIAAPSSSDAPSTYSDGLSISRVAAAQGFPLGTGARGMLYTWARIDGSNTAAAQLLSSNTSSDPVLQYRRALGDASWGSWQPVAMNTDVAAWEVDNSTEGGTGTTSLTTSNADYATVTLTIPSDWGSWKCEAYATFNHEQTSSSQNCWGFIRIDGTDQQEHGFTATSKQESSAVGGRRTGMTTTGSRSVSFRARAGSTADSPRVGDIYLYARAVRTS